MVNIVILGTDGFRNAQCLVVERLLQLHGLPALRRDDETSEVWGLTPPEGESRLACDHFEFEGTLMGADTKPELMMFLKEAMELPGVYDSCPEHNKRRFWRNNQPRERLKKVPQAKKPTRGFSRPAPPRAYSGF